MSGRHIHGMQRLASSTLGTMVRPHARLQACPTSHYMVQAWGAVSECGHRRVYIRQCLAEYDHVACGRRHAMMPSMMGGSPCCRGYA